ncbi:MAG: EthD domain-containing protein [Gammaproteobacteria bacterium]|nr:EthD domain-containing protein [Gammaproteobacteria bacterium]
MIKLYALFGEGSPTSPLKLNSAAAGSALTRRFPGLLRYRQFERTAEQFEGLIPAPFRASAELWIDDSEDPAPILDELASAATSLPEAFAEDPVRLVQSAEHNISGEPMQDSGFKATFLFNRKADMDLGEFHAYWLGHHGPIAAQTQDAERYVQSHISVTDRSWDGITELFWADYPTALASMASEQMRVDQSSDAQNFVDGESLVLFLSQETP